MAKGGRGEVRVGTFGSMEDADRAFRRLVEEAEFRHEEISIVCRDAGPPGAGEEASDRAEEGRDSGPPAAPSGEVAVGGLLGDLLGLVGDFGGAVVGAASPLLGPGGLDVRVRFARAFIGRGLKEEEAERYDQAVEQGRILVVAECRGPAREKRIAAAERIFAEAGADPLALKKR